MRNKPNHTCFPALRECAGCAFELGASLAGRKPEESAKYVWMVVGSSNPCDIRRYAFSHKEAIEQLAHRKKGKFKDVLYPNGVWTLFKLVRVKKTK